MGGKRAAAGAVGSEGGTGAKHGEAKAQTAKKKAKVSEAPPPAPLSRVALEGYWRLTMKEPENGDTCRSKRTTGYLRLGGSDKYVEGCMYVNGYRDPMGEYEPWTQELWASEQADAEDGSGELRFICTLNNPHACGIGEGEGYLTLKPTELRDADGGIIYTGVWDASVQLGYLYTKRGYDEEAGFSMDPFWMLREAEPDKSEEYGFGSVG